MCHELGQSQQKVRSPPERVSLDRRFRAAWHTRWVNDKTCLRLVRSHRLASMPRSQHSVDIKRCTNESALATAAHEAVCGAIFFSPRRAVMFTGSVSRPATCLPIDGIVGGIQSVA